MIDFKEDGLSMSEASTVSNICYQRALEIEAKINQVNNYSKKVTVDSKDYTVKVGYPIMENIVDLIEEKSQLHSIQAFLMEGIKQKESLIKEIESAQMPEFEEEMPIRQVPDKPILIPNVSEEWGWGKLSPDEYAEYLEVEAYSSTIGKFIHKDGKLTKLRAEIPTLELLEWMEVETGKLTPVEISLHHTPELLMSIHEELAAKHRKHEKRVNYFKAKVKNLVSAENARITSENSRLQTEYTKNLKNSSQIYNSAYEEWMSKFKAHQLEFETTRLNARSAIVLKGIDIPQRFRNPINEIIKSMKEVAKG